MYHGDIRLGDTIDIKFTTRSFSTGAPTTLAGTPVVSAYPDNSVTQVTAGITLTVDFDAVTGLHNIRIVASGANGYITGTNYALVITTGTVGGVSVVGEVVGTFSIEKREANVTRVGGTAQTAGDIIGDTNDVQARLPAALVGGRIDASVGAMAAAVITAAAHETGAIDAAAIAADAIGASELATDAVAEIVNALFDELTAEARVAGSYGQLLKDNLNAAVSSRSVPGDAMALTAAAINLIWDELTAEARVAGSYGQLFKDDINATIGSRAIPGDLMGLVASAITAAKFAANAIDANAFAQAAADKVFGSGGATLAELAQAIPSATPRPDQAMMLLYMAMRNLLQVTATEKRITNDLGTVIAKKALSDDGTTYAEAEMVAGP